MINIYEELKRLNQMINWQNNDNNALADRIAELEHRVGTLQNESKASKEQCQ